MLIAQNLAVKKVGMVVLGNVEAATVVAGGFREAAAKLGMSVTEVSINFQDADCSAQMVQLQSRQSFRRCHHRGHLDEVVLRLAGDVGEDGGRQGAQVGNVMKQEMLDAVVVEADGVEHAGRGLDRSRRPVAGPRLARHGLGDDAAELGEVNDAGHLPRVAERARGDQDRVAEVEAAQSDGQVHLKGLSDE